MVELFEQEIKDNGRQSSKGNQLKWLRNDVWYKADYLGYEGLSEYVVSKLLINSTLNSDEFVEYELETIRYKSQIFNGCRSFDFSDSFQPITLERLFKTMFGFSLSKSICGISDHSQRLEYMVGQVERATGIKNFGIYMNKLFTLDAVFLNEDRHTHNISILWDGNSSFKLCPIYDNGAALLSDTALDYPIGCDIYSEKDHVHAKTICDSLDEQLEISENLYGTNLRFTWGIHEVENCLDKAEIYNTDIRTRVKDLLMGQRRK